MKSQISHLEYKKSFYVQNFTTNNISAYFVLYSLTTPSSFNCRLMSMVPLHIQPIYPFSNFFRGFTVTEFALSKRVSKDTKASGLHFPSGSDIIYINDILMA